MTTIETSCDRCGPVETTPARVALRLGGAAASYRFRCPSCRHLVRRAADDTTVLLLVRAGVRPRGLARLRWGRADGSAAVGTATFTSAFAPPAPRRAPGRRALERGQATTGSNLGSSPEPGPITWDDVVEFALRLGVEPAPASAATASPRHLGLSLAGQASQ